VISIPTHTLNDGTKIPAIGLGTYPMSDAEAERAVSEALGLGYRLVDTATNYSNESGVGFGLTRSGVPREEVVVTTKLPGRHHGYAETLASFEDSRRRLGLDYVDLYLIHWPLPRIDRYVDSWRAMIKLREEGLVASIGVSNFQIAHLERLKAETGVVPAINQVELHPRFQQKALRAYHAKEGIATEAWSPLGQGTLLSDPALTAIGKKYGKSSAQVILRWHLDIGNVVIPKSVTPARIVENFQVFDFKLAPEDIAAIEKLDDPKGKIGPDPDSFAMV